MQIIENQEHYKHIIEEGLENAKKSIWIATANLKDMKIERATKRYISIAEYLNDIANYGIQIRLLHSGEPSKHFRDSISMLLKNKNFKLKRCIRNHFKTVIIDGKWMYLGSANMTGAGMGLKNENRRNFELGIITEDSKEIDKVQSLFNLIWENELCEDCKMKKYCL